MYLEFGAMVYCDRNLQYIGGPEPRGSFPSNLLCEIVSVLF